MSAGTVSCRVFRWRFLVQELVGPALQHSPIPVSREAPPTGIHDQPQVQPPVPLPNAKRLAEDADRAGRTDPADENHTARCDRLPIRRHLEARGQLPQPQLPAVLCRCQAPEPGMDVLGVDRLLQPRQLPRQVARSPKPSLEPAGLEPAVEVLHAAVELRLPLGDEDRLDAEPQAQPDDPREIPCRRPPAAQLAGVVELDLGRPSQILPTFAEEPEDLVPATGIGQAQAEGAVEGILADPDGRAVAAALEVDRPDPIDLVELVRGPGLRAGILLARQQWDQPDLGQSQAVALQNPLDGAGRGERPDVQSLQFGEDGRGPDQAVASGRRGMGLEPATDGEDGALQLGRDALGDVVVGPGQVVETLGAVLQVATPPLVEPRLAAAQSRADVLDGAAGETETDGGLTRREVVVHGVLRGTAAGDCPRGTFET